MFWVKSLIKIYHQNRSLQTPLISLHLTAHIKGSLPPKQSRWVKYYQTWKNHWHLVTFFDDKKNSFGCSDSLPFYFHYMRKWEENFSKKQHGAGFLIVLEVFGYDADFSLSSHVGYRYSNCYKPICFRENCRENWWPKFDLSVVKYHITFYKIILGNFLR